MEPFNSELTPSVLQGWLEWASARLLATPSTKIRPQEPVTIWPEYSQDKFEILDFRAQIMLRALAPSSTEIPIMDEILLLPNLCFNENRRRVVRLRSLVDPLNSRYIYSWARLAERLHSGPRIIKRMYSLGLEEISRKVPPDQVCRLGIALNGGIPSCSNTA